MTRQKQVVSQRFEFTVKTIRALPGGQFVEAGQFNCGHPQDAYNVANRLQREFDEDCDPCRTYVYKGTDPVPIHAGLEKSTFRPAMGNTRRMS